MKRAIFSVTFAFRFLIPLLIGFGGIVSGQDQIVSVAILNFQDDTGANAPAELGQKLAQDLQQKIAIGYKDLLPRLVAGSDAAAAKGLTIDQIAALGKQNGARYVVRGGLLTFTSEPAGSDSKITAQLYADIISADTATLIATVRAEGSGMQSGPAPRLSAIDVKNDQFSSSGVGQALTSATTQLADSIHQAITAGTRNASANPSTQSMTAVSQALEALKAALASKAALMRLD